MGRLILITFLACTSSSVDRVVDYLKSCWRMKLKTKNSSEYNDSLLVINRRFGLNLDSVRKIIRTWDNVDQFERLINQLKEEDR